MSAYNSWQTTRMVALQFPLICYSILLAISMYLLLLAISIYLLLLLKLGI